MRKSNEILNELIQKHGNSRKSLLPILQGIVEQERYLSHDIMIEVAEALDISAAEVYGTASFYSFLDTAPRGKYIIRLCKTIVCEMHGKHKILQTIEDMLKIKLGQNSADMKFSLLETNCLGWCHKGPAMLVNNQIYIELTPEKVRTIIEEYQTM